MWCRFHVHDRVMHNLCRCPGIDDEKVGHKVSDGHPREQNLWCMMFYSGGAHSRSHR
jgi:hypothetical protein